MGIFQDYLLQIWPSKEPIGDSGIRDNPLRSLKYLEINKAWVHQIPSHPHIFWMKIPEK
jgi:hypothetical protein